MSGEKPLSPEEKLVEGKAYYIFVWEAKTVLLVSFHL